MMIHSVRQTRGLTGCLAAHGNILTLKYTRTAYNFFLKWWAAASFTLQSDHGSKRDNLNVAGIKIGRKRRVSISDSPHLSPIPLPVSLSVALSLRESNSPLCPPIVSLLPFHSIFLLFHFIVSLSSEHKTLCLQPILLILIHFSVLFHLSVLSISSALTGFTYSAHPVAWRKEGETGERLTDSDKLDLLKYWLLSHTSVHLSLSF